MKIWSISDTHGMHRRAIIPENIDCIIFGGDCTNYMDLLRNQIEFEDFFDWFYKLDIKYKVIIAGNHDTFATKKYNIDKLKESNIIYLEHEDVIIEEIRIFGSPFTPTFGNWNFMKDRSKLDKYWTLIDGNVDILVTHGPPMGMLDLSRNRDNILEYCGDKALMRHVKKIKPSFHVFGHIHNFDDCIN
jgi:Icc-related predicted phosphoesterase